MAPGIPLLAADCGAQPVDQRGQNPVGMVPSDAVEQLERLVDEVDHVAAVEIEMVGGRGHDHVGDVGAGRALPHRGQQAAFRPLGAADLDKVAQPALEVLVGNLLVVQGADLELGRHSRTVPRHVNKPVKQGRNPVVSLQVIAEVGHRAEDGQARGPVLPVPHAVERPKPGDLIGPDAAVQEADDRFADDEAEILLHPFPKPARPTRHRIPLRPGRAQVDLAPLDSDRIGLHVVGEQIEGAAAGQVEAGVMPVAGENPVLDRAAIEGEAHVRTAVVDRVDLSLVMEQHDRDGTARDEERTPGLHLRQGPDVNLVI